MRAAADSSDSRCLRAASRDPAEQRLGYSETRSAALASLFALRGRPVSLRGDYSNGRKEANLRGLTS